MDWAKQNWAFDLMQSGASTPTDMDLFTPTFPKPSCPLNGAYRLGPIFQTPTCNLGGHVD
jgi:hypothetical protein